MVCIQQKHRLTNLQDENIDGEYTVIGNVELNLNSDTSGIFGHIQQHTSSPLCCAYPFPSSPTPADYGDDV